MGARFGYRLTGTTPDLFCRVCERQDRNSSNEGQATHFGMGS